VRTKATHLRILFGIRVHTKECSLWNDVGALCVRYSCRLWVELGRDIVGGVPVNNTGYDTSPIVSNESLYEASSETERDKG
jgi:hypothetical protein